MKRGFLSVLFLFLFSQACFAQQTFQSKDQTKQISNQFMRAIVALDVPGAFKILQPYFRTSSEEEFAKLQVQTINQLDAYTERFGFPLGAELVKEEEVGDILLQYSYIEKYESNVLRWIFVFYKPKDQWIFKSLSWDEKIQPLMD